MKKIVRTKKQIEELTARLNLIDTDKYKREQDYKRAKTLLINRLRRLKKELLHRNVDLTIFICEVMDMLKNGQSDRSITIQNQTSEIRKIVENEFIDEDMELLKVTISPKGRIRRRQDDSCYRFRQKEGGAEYAN